MRDPLANKIARDRLERAIREGTDYVLVTRTKVRAYYDYGRGPQVQANYVGTEHVQEMLEDALALKRYIKEMRR
jgi:hypothetical protein